MKPAPRLLALTSAPAGPPVAAVERPAPPAPTSATPAASAAPTLRLAPSPVPALGQVLLWLVTGCEFAAEPSAVTVSATTTDVHIHVPSAALFRTWLRYMGCVPADVRTTTDLLGPLAEATIVLNGWTLHLRLSGPAVQELP